MRSNLWIDFLQDLGNSIVVAFSCIEYRDVTARISRGIIQHLQLKRYAGSIQHPSNTVHELNSAFWCQVPIESYEVWRIVLIQCFIALCHVKPWRNAQELLGKS